MGGRAEQARPVRDRPLEVLLRADRVAVGVPRAVAPQRKAALHGHGAACARAAVDPLRAVMAGQYEVVADVCEHPPRSDDELRPLRPNRLEVASPLATTCFERALST